MKRSAIVWLVVFGLFASACSVHRLGDGSDVATGPGSFGEGSGSTTDADAGLDGTSDDSTVEGAGSDLGTATGSSSTPGAGGGAEAPTTDTSPARQPTANDAGESVPRTASAPGVRPDEIDLGILHTSDAFFAAGGASTKSVEEVIAPFIAEINDQGGINGRKVIPRISKYDPLSADSMNAACVEQAEDFKVFTAIAQQGFYGDAEVCMANKGVPLLTGNNSSEKTNVERERGFVRQTNQNKDRNIKNWIDWMISAGVLKTSTKTGLIYVDVPEDRDLVNEVVLPYLDSKGMPRPVMATLSPSIAQTPSESQSAVLKFSSENVQLVLPFVSFLRILIFAQQAESFSYRPGYSVSDFGLLSTDAMGGMPPSQWEGVRGITVLPTGMGEPGQLPPSAAFKECHAVYRKYGQEIATQDGSPDGIEVANILHYCQHVALWADAARRAGTNPTRADWLTAMDQTGTWNHRVGLSERLTYAPGKYDGADLYAVIKWKSNCTDNGGCYRQIEGFRPGKW